MEQNDTNGKDYGLYIDGHYVEPRGSERLPVINPATGETWATISDASAPDVEQAVDAARACFEEAGFPAGVFNVVTGLGSGAGDALVRSRSVDCVAFTGSRNAGAAVATAAVGHFAEVVLELGGKSPNILFADAPLDAAVAGILAGIFAASGQTCIAGSRALVQRSIYDQVIAREEVFGPVLSIIPFETEEEAVSIANDSDFGLAAGVWTTDLSRAHRMARRLSAGTIWINTYRSLAPNMPFGGYKASGIGRENGLDALRSFTQAKSVWVELQPAVGDPFSVKL